MTAASPKVLAVVVTFHPEAAALRNLLLSLSGQVADVLVVDNGPRHDNAVWEEMCALQIANLRMVRFGDNLGIAAALNVGVEAALAEGHDYLLLSDQDSLPERGMVAELIKATEDIEAKGRRVGGLCPQYYDQTTSQVFPFQMVSSGGSFYRNEIVEAGHPAVEVVTSISSGTLIPRAALLAVGSMHESLFIDYVDMEWCHRARALGFGMFATANARIRHRLGERRMRVWFFGFRVHSEYSPVRLYYRVRNFVLVCRMPHTPWRWSMKASLYSLGTVYAHALFAYDRRRQVSMIVRGFIDGVRGCAGRIDRVKRIDFRGCNRTGDNQK